MQQFRQHVDDDVASLSKIIKEKDEQLETFGKTTGRKKVNQKTLCSNKERTACYFK